MSEVYQEGKEDTQSGGTEDLKQGSEETTIAPDLDAEGNEVTLEPEGDGAQKRINQIYRRMKDSERDLQSERNALTEEREARIRLEERLRAVEETRREPVVQTKELGETDLQAALEVNDHASAAKIMATMSKQEAQKLVTADRQKAGEQTRILSQVEIAKRQVDEYLTQDPALKNNTHPRRKEVEAAYIANKSLGVPDDARAELLALNAVFGSASKMKTSNPSRRQEDNFVEQGAGGGFNAQTNTSGLRGLEHVPARYIEHWTKRGYSHENMVKESKYLTPRQLERK